MNQMATLKRILLGTFAMLGMRGMSVMRVIAIPLAITLIMEVIVLYMKNPYLKLASVWISWFLYVFIAVSIHRVCLAGEDSLPKFGTITRPGRHDAIFLLTSIGLCAALYGAGYLLNSVGGLLGIPSSETTGSPIRQGIAMFAFWWGSVILLVTLMSRFALWLPAAALGQRYSIAEIWAMGKGRTLLLFVALIIIPGLVSLFFGLLAKTVFAAFPLDFLIKMIPVVIAVVLLSLSYGELAREKGLWRTST